MSVERLHVLLTRLGVELEGSTIAGQVSRWLRGLHNVPDEDTNDCRLFVAEIGEIGVRVSAQYDWNAGRFEVRDWSTYNI
jgi:hypothetical protein